VDSNAVVGHFLRAVAESSCPHVSHGNTWCYACCGADSADRCLKPAIVALETLKLARNGRQGNGMGAERERVDRFRWFGSALLQPARERSPALTGVR